MRERKNERIKEENSLIRVIVLVVHALVDPVLKPMDCILS